VKQATVIDSVPESPCTDDSQCGLSIAELDQRLEKAVRENERSERLICDCLLAMVERRGYEKFGFNDIYYLRGRSLWIFSAQNPIPAPSRPAASKASPDQRSSCTGSSRLDQGESHRPGRHR
jgi:hypothetical protein